MGIALIRNVHQEYSEIIAHYNSSLEDLLVLKEEIGEKLSLHQCDFENDEDTDRFVEALIPYQPTYIVHLPAPKCKNLHFKKIKWEQYEYGIHTQIRSIVKILSALTPYMAKQKYGKIVFMLTSYVTGKPPKFLTDYVMIKYALLGLMRALSVELAPQNICVNAVSPAMMETKFLSELNHLIIEQNKQANPSGELLKADEVIQTIEYLLSGASDKVSGQNIVIG